MQSSDQKTRLLLVEDEKKLAYSLERRFQRTGYVVEMSFDGDDAQTKLSSHEFTLIILDLNLPKKSGLEVLQTLRAQGNATPVIILSSNSATEDRVKGLELGADDYLTKPFDFAELLARSEALMRRARHSHQPALQAGDLTFDIVQGRVRRAANEILLTPKELALLKYLLRNKNQILTRRRLAEQVWGYKFDTGTNVVDVYINYLRKKIDEGFPKKLLHTVHGEGFILMDD